jgi:hypothetical protein
MSLCTQKIFVIQPNTLPVDSSPPECFLLPGRNFRRRQTSELSFLLSELVLDQMQSENIYIRFFFDSKSTHSKLHAISPFFSSDCRSYALYKTKLNALLTKLQLITNIFQNYVFQKVFPVLLEKYQIQILL